MRILVVGAGGIGGYFGGRLLEAGRDVTFLVRPRRAAQLAEDGLVIESPHGNLHYPAPPTVQADGLNQQFDLVLLSCKAYDLDDAIRSFTPAVGPNTCVLPLLNGLRHLEVLDEHFGGGAVLGGLCVISSVLAGDGRILHLNALHSITFGERDGMRSPRLEAIEQEFSAARFDVISTGTITHDMWEKWVFIATMAGITCLMRSTLGDIEAAGGGPLTLELLDECAEIAAGWGFPPREAAVERSRATFTAPGSPLTASMYRDIERGGRTEGEHILGDLLRRKRGPAGATSILRAAYAHVATYEVRRARLEAEAS
jgi:2-dehydropantoate 2-reductase